MLLTDLPGDYQQAADEKGDLEGEPPDHHLPAQLRIRPQSDPKDAPENTEKTSKEVPTLYYVLLIIGIFGCLSPIILITILRKRRKRWDAEECQSGPTGEYREDIPEVEGIMTGFEGWRPPEDVQQFPKAADQTFPKLPPRPLSKGDQGRYMPRGPKPSLPKRSAQPLPTFAIPSPRRDHL